jgi:hypothetical protein
LTTAEDFAHYLDRLRTDAGAPSIRQIATQAAYGKLRQL